MKGPGPFISGFWNKKNVKQGKQTNFRLTNFTMINKYTKLIKMALVCSLEVYCANLELLLIMPTERLFNVCLTSKVMYF